MIEMPTRIVHWPDPVLTRPAVAVASFDEDLRALAGRMVELMHAAKGVGLAAPQVGAGLRLFVCNPAGRPDDEQVYVNPRIVEADGLVEADEGCLSLPGVQVTTRRAARCRITAQDLDGQPTDALGEELLARVFQHEIDHLDGRLLLDLMSPAEKIANRRAVRQMREAYATPASR